MRIPVLVAGVALVPALALAGAGDPQRKAGWWEVTTSTAAPMQMTQKTNFCTDAQTETKFSPATHRVPNLGAADCRASGPPQRTANGWTFSSTCRTAGGTTAATTGTVSGDLGSAYRVEALTRVGVPPMPQMYETKMTVTARWLGPCPAGRVPGDLVMENGVVHNLNAMGAPRKYAGR